MQMRLRHVAGMVLAAMATASALHAAEPPTGAPTTVSGVDVIARPRGPAPPMKAVRAFVGSLGVMSTGEQLAIWSRSAVPGAIGRSLAGTSPASSAAETICPAVFGLPPDYARFIIDRLRRVGALTGAPVSPTDCRPSEVNVVIAFPADATDFIHELADRAPTAFGFAYHGLLRQDLKTPVKPIRAWYATEVLAVTARASRLSTQHQSLIEHVLIIVDARQSNALNMGQLGDYISMTTLAEIKTSSIPADASTILNVFSDIAAGRSPADGMTRMDVAYLKALYGVAPGLVGSLQNDQIADLVRRNLAAR
jgi:hypothetical protein